MQKTYPLYFVFLKTKELGSPFIRLATWSPWSHVAVVTSEGVVYETKLRKGVHTNTLSALLNRASTFQFGEVTCTRNPKQFLHNQLGKPYDWRAIIGIGVHHDWQDENQWFCSEHAAAAAKYGGVDIIRKPLNRVTPGDLFESTQIKVYPENEIIQQFSWVKR